MVCWSATYQLVPLDHAPCLFAVVETQCTCQLLCCAHLSYVAMQTIFMKIK